MDINQDSHLFELANPNRHWGCRLNDRITWSGFRAVMLQNELLQIVVLLDKGAEIIQFLYKPLDLDFLWRSENPLRDPSRFVPTGGSPVAPFFDHWSGGWFEVVPNGGPACEYKGASLGFFAETINVPWEYRILEDHPQRVSLGLWVKTYRTPFLLQKTLTLETGKSVLFIEERLTNEGQEPMEFMWGHHPVVGAPFLDESCYLSAPDCQVEVMHAEDGPDHRMGLHQVERWPIIKDRHGQPLDLRCIPPPSARPGSPLIPGTRASAPEAERSGVPDPDGRAARTMDNCYLRDFKEGWIAVTNRNRGAGFGLSWDADVFRYVWIWQAFGGGIGYPWYGRTYSLGLEPWTSYPCAGLAEAVQRGTAAKLEAGQSLTAWMTAVAYTDVDIVSHITREGIVS